MNDTATRPVHKRIAVALDFDETLAPDSFQGLLEYCGCDPEDFHRQRVQPLVAQGWEEQNAKIYALVQESRAGDGAGTISRERIDEFAAGFEPYPGAGELLDRLRAHVRRQDPDIEVEYYVVSSGLADIVAGCRLAPHFARIWGCELAYSETGEIDFVRRVVTHFGKTRYLRLISRVGPQGYDESPRELYRMVPDEQLHVPFSQVVYVGDGSSDLPAFTLIHQEGGIAIGVSKPDGRDSWEAAAEIGGDQRVDAVAVADFDPDSQLARALTLAVDRVCAQISLRGLSGGAGSG